MKRSITLFGSNAVMEAQLKKLGFQVLTYSSKIEKFTNDILTWNEIPPVLLNEEGLYVINFGILTPKSFLEMNERELVKSLRINLLYVVKVVELLIRDESKARIICIGSESGSKGSFDTSYFLGKAALIAYVREKQMAYKNQQLLLISPSMVEDGRMTTQRNDQFRVENARVAHPKKRLARWVDITNLINNLFVLNDTYLTNCELTYNGGKFTRCP